jgi:hypothetical protein
MVQRILFQLEGRLLALLPNIRLVSKLFMDKHSSLFRPTVIDEGNVSILLAPGHTKIRKFLEAVPRLLVSWLLSLMNVGKW